MSIIKTIAAGFIAISAAASIASAGNRESATFTNVTSDGTSTFKTQYFPGGYSAQYLIISGTWSRIAADTLPTESVIEARSPGGVIFTMQPITTTATLGTSSGSLNATRTVNSAIFRLPSLATVTGTWTFRFFETVNNTGTDARWDTITITLNDGPPQNVTDLGVLSTERTTSTPLAPNRVTWYKFTIAKDVVAGSGTYLLGGLAGLPVSTEDGMLALYDANGRLISMDDNDGDGNAPQLTFGAGLTGRVIETGDGLPIDGRDGSLAAGVYYLAAANAPATFSAGFTVTSASTGPLGWFTLYLNTNAFNTVNPAGGTGGTRQVITR